MGCGNPCGETCQGLEPTSSAEGQQTPSGCGLECIRPKSASWREKRQRGGELGFLPCPLGFTDVSPGSRAEKTCFLAQERGFNKQRAVPLTGWAGVGQQCHRSTGPSEGGACPVSTQQDPDVLGWEEARESSRTSTIQWPCASFLSQLGLVWATAQLGSGPACLPRPDTYSREQQKRQADQCGAADRLGRDPCCPQPSLVHHELSSRP